MIRRTLGQVRLQIAKISGTSGYTTSSSEVVELINQATEELANEGDWPGVVDRYLFNSLNGNIVLPYFLDRIMGVAINNIPYSLKSPWYEFVEYGPGPQGQANWVDSVIDRDEVAIQSQFPSASDGPWTLYTKCEVNESVGGINPQIIVNGAAADGRRVRTYAGTSWIDGEALSLVGGTANYTFYGTAQFESVTSVIKPKTNGYVELWAKSQGSASDVLLATYAPEETSPSYHAYYLPSLKTCGLPYGGYSFCCGTSNTEQPSNITVLVRARKRFIPVANDNDVLMISNIPALISMVMAIQKRSVSDPVGYGGYKAAAVDIMNKEAKSYRGAAKTPALTFSVGASIGAMPYVR